MKQIIKTFVLLLVLITAFAGCGGSGSDAPPPPPTTLIAFATSAQGTGDLSTWTDAGSAIGVAAGDNICQTAATTAGLSGTFKAWLSDNTTDAYCHVQGYTGKKSANCGQSTLPVAAGPWVRTHDGYPFAPTIDNLVNNNQVFVPVAYDESGTLLFAFTFYYTGTKANGTVDTYTCTNWTSSLLADAAQFGGTEDASGWWTERGGVGCNTTLVSLLCLQAGAGKPLPSLPAVPSGAKRVFVTSVKGTGDLTSWTDYSGIATGVAAGDQICQNRAAAAVLANAGNYKAWLSDTSTDAIAHVTVTATNGPWYRLDDVIIAADKTALKTAPLFTAIAVNEYGAYITGDLWVWSGTYDTGIKHANRCADWTSNGSGDHGRIGDAPTASIYWTNYVDETCDYSAALYCFEDD
jgi:hypothetical protein